jgi:hypothetical protein
VIRAKKALLVNFSPDKRNGGAASVGMLVIVRTRRKAFMRMIVRGLVIMVMMVLMTVVVAMVARIGGQLLGLKTLHRNDTAAESDDHAEYQQP